MIVAGIDPSLKNTAVAFYGEEGTDYVDRFPSKPRGNSVRNRVARYRDVVKAICQYMHEGVKIICIEGYSFASEGRSITGICEFGGILRYELCQFDCRIIEVAPTTLKKFGCGRGNAGKTEVVTAVCQRYGVLFKTDDEYDAYVLSRMAAVVAGIDEAQTNKQREAIKTITGET